MKIIFQKVFINLKTREMSDFSFKEITRFENEEENYKGLPFNKEQMETVFLYGSIASGFFGLIGLLIKFYELYTIEDELDNKEQKSKILGLLFIIISRLINTFFLEILCFTNQSFLTFVMSLMSLIFLIPDIKTLFKNSVKKYNPAKAYFTRTFLNLEREKKRSLTTKILIKTLRLLRISDRKDIFESRDLKNFSSYFSQLTEIQLFFYISFIILYVLNFKQAFVLSIFGALISLLFCSILFFIVNR
ncbi:MAG: hypothetical protein ACK5XN_13455 [Bacteroidota bacterium]